MASFNDPSIHKCIDVLYYYHCQNPISLLRFFCFSIRLCYRGEYGLIPVIDISYFGACRSYPIITWIEDIFAT